MKEVLKDLKSFGFVRRGFIGVEFYSDGQDGAVITNIISGSPAQKAKLKIKDRIIEFAGNKIKTPRNLPKEIRKTAVGKRVPLKVIRNGKQIRLNITPQMLEKNSISSLQQNLNQKKQRIKGQNISGGFQVVPASAPHLRRLNLPDLGARYPLVVDIKQGSPAFKGGLRVGDLLFQINGKRISKISELKRTLKNGKNRLNVLRYHHRYDKYLLVSVNLTI